VQITLLKQITEATSISSFIFSKPNEARYVAGQYAQFTLEHSTPDERGEKRWFTLSSSPTDDFLSITTKFAGQNSSSFKKALFDLEIGRTLEMDMPEGDFTLPTDPGLRLVFIAGGIGVTPFHSMIKWLSDSGQKRQIKLIYAAQTPDQIAFTQLFAQAGVIVKPVVGEQLTASALLQDIGDMANVLVYLSGPEPMVESLSESLIAAGVPKEKLKGDYFPGYENLYSN